MLLVAFWSSQDVVKQGGPFVKLNFGILGTSGKNEVVPKKTIFGKLESLYSNYSAYQISIPSS